MSGEKKPKTFLEDVTSTLKGVTNVISGKVFDPKTWSEDDAVPPVVQPQVKSDDDAEEVEEVRTVRRRRGGTFAAAPKAKPPAGAGDGKSDGAGDGKSDGAGDGKTEAGKAAG